MTAKVLLIDITKEERIGVRIKGPREIFRGILRLGIREKEAAYHWSQKWKTRLVLSVKQTKGTKTFMEQIVVILNRWGMICSHHQPLKDQFLLSEKYQSNTGVTATQGSENFKKGIVSGK